MVLFYEMEELLDGAVPIGCGQVLHACHHVQLLSIAHLAVPMVVLLDQVVVNSRKIVF